MGDFVSHVQQGNPDDMSDESIKQIFDGAGDFNCRKIKCCGNILYAYAIDGLTSGGDISEYVFKPIME